MSDKEVMSRKRKKLECPREAGRIRNITTAPPELLRLRALVKEAKTITNCIVIMDLQRWFPEDLQKAITRFNRKVK